MKKLIPIGAENAIQVETKDLSSYEIVKHPSISKAAKFVGATTQSLAPRLCFEWRSVKGRKSDKAFLFRKVKQ